MPGEIPRVIHQVWIGNVEPHPGLLRMQERMMRVNKGWELRVWREPDIPVLHNQAVYAKVKGITHKSDVVRYELLWRHPGVYADWDIHWLRPLDDYIGGCTEFFVPEGWDDEGRPILNNGIFGVGPGNPIASALVARLESSAARYLEHNRSRAVGVGYFTSVVRSFPDACIWPRQCFHQGHALRAVTAPEWTKHTPALGVHFFQSNGVIDKFERMARDCGLDDPTRKIPTLADVRRAEASGVPLR